MITIASLFDSHSRLQTDQVWRLLETECELVGIRSIPYPHFSWFTGDDFTDDHMDDLLLEISAQLNVFEVKTSGLGVFTSESPVLYLPIVKTAELMEYHRLIWSRLHAKVIGINTLYAPENWIPHITVGYGDVTFERISCALESLLNYDLTLTIKIDNIAWLSRADENARVEKIIKLDAPQG